MRQNWLLVFFVFFIPRPVAADSCFCKINCYWNDKDSSDFHKVIDVSCTDKIEKQKKTAKRYLLKHVQKSHPEFSQTDLKSRTEIMCYRSKSKNKKNLKDSDLK